MTIAALQDRPARATPIDPATGWNDALAALRSARAAELAAEEADAAQGAGEWLYEARAAAEDALFATRAPGAAAITFKLKYGRARWAEFEDMPSEWWAGIMADCERLAGITQPGTDAALPDLDRILADAPGAIPPAPRGKMMDHVSRAEVLTSYLRTLIESASDLFEGDGRAPDNTGLNLTAMALEAVDELAGKVQAIAVASRSEVRP